MLYFLGMHKYIVESNEQLTATTQLLTLKAKQPSDNFNYEPGQYAAIGFKRKYRPTPVRCFSIVTAPDETGKLQFCMRTKGHYTRAVTKLQPGEEVRVMGPFGGFVIEPEYDNQLVLLAGGIGITPFMSMLRHAALTQSPLKITLLFSSQDQNDAPFADELMELEAKNPNFRVLYTISSGPLDRFPDRKAVPGRISPELLDRASGSSYSDNTYFVCGPPGFMKGMSATLRNKGVAKHKIITEAFSQGPNRQTGKMTDWPFNMYSLTAVGVVLGSFAIMLSDLIKTLPPILNATALPSAKAATNQRQQNLDALVNGLPANNSTTAASDQAAGQSTSQSSSTSSQSTNSTSTPSSSTNTTPTPVYTQPTPRTCGSAPC